MSLPAHPNVRPEPVEGRSGRACAAAKAGPASQTAPGRLLGGLGLQPRKGLGQHFLVSQSVLERIVDAADTRPGDTVVEVGPGLGALTEVLARRAGRVLALELDTALCQALQKHFADRPHVQVVHADALKVNLDTVVPAGQPYKFVANLPYYAATAIIRRFLEAAHKPTVVVATVQREVAQGMAAPEGKRGLLGVATQFFGSPRIVSIVRPGSFHPPPKVTSAVVRIDVHPSPPVEVPSESAFFALVRAGFAAPRKQLRGGLSHALRRPPAEVERALAACAIDPTRRAETLSLEEWAALVRTGSEAGWTL